MQASAGGILVVEVVKVTETLTQTVHATVTVTVTSPESSPQSTGTTPTTSSSFSTPGRAAIATRISSTSILPAGPLAPPTSSAPTASFLSFTSVSSVPSEPVISQTSSLTSATPSNAPSSLPVSPVTTILTGSPSSTLLSSPTTSLELQGTALPATRKVKVNMPVLASVIVVSVLAVAFLLFALILCYRRRLSQTSFPLSDAGGLSLPPDPPTYPVFFDEDEFDDDFKTPPPTSPTSVQAQHGSLLSIMEPENKGNGNSHPAPRGSRSSIVKRGFDFMNFGKTSGPVKPPVDTNVTRTSGSAKDGSPLPGSAGTQRTLHSSIQSGYEVLVSILPGFRP
ncbi:hypothetical protein ONZ45_g4756 [Pleurotus djamor]|nr:hypothetical protein ONZ45_g4756 [Pleurotus djamor]